MASEQSTAPRPGDAAALIELYYQKGWTDGLPVMPPSEDSVGAMLRAAGLKGDELVGEVEARNTRVTADKVAVNAVMAGCLPEYMPVVIAAVKGLCHPDFGYHGIATSTGGAAVAIIVNGPIARQLEINCGDNAFGPGFRPNMTIGRALRLLMMNAINTRPGKLDRATLGTPGKISFCFAENEADSPWQPLHVERGLQAEESAATVFACEGIIPTYNQLSDDPAALLLGMADALANRGSMNIIGQQDVFVVFAGEHTNVLRESGWSKAQVKQYLFDQAKRSIADCKRAGRLPGEIVPEDEHEFRHAVRKPEDISIVVAGGDAGSFSACLTGWGSHKTTRSVTTAVEAP
ncbi:MAG: thioredoxin [SAR324 cluster bacterium]|nr:thioredoxin [SAR324 cluster bacterium]